MNTIKKAEEVLKTKYGIDCRVFNNKLYVSAWNDDLSDSIDIEVSINQIEDLGKQYNNKTINKCKQ